MDNTSLNKILKDRAVGLGLCRQWQTQWASDWSEDKMIAKYKEGIDFCLANHYPSNGFIKQNFSLEALRGGGIFVDDTRSVNDMCTVVSLGNSKLRIRYNGGSIGEVYATDNSGLSLTAKDNSHVIIHLLGNAKIVAEQQNKASILVLRHSENCSVISKGNVRIKDELDWLK